MGLKTLNLLWLLISVLTGFVYFGIWFSETQLMKKITEWILNHVGWTFIIILSAFALLADDGENK